MKGMKERKKVIFLFISYGSCISNNKIVRKNAGPCERSNEAWGSTKCAEFLD
jgi:hypothetical protein